jgi:ribosomal protein S2
MIKKINYTLSQLAIFDILFGYTAANWDPRSNYYLLGRSNGIDVFDLNKTYACIKLVVNLISGTLARKGIIWVVNEHFDLFKRNDLLSNLQQSFPEMQFHNDKWMKGSLTNFRFVRHFDTEKFPHVIFSPNALNNHFVIAECFGIRIPSVALIDSRDNPASVFAPIPSNSAAMMPIFFFYFLIAKLVSNARDFMVTSFIRNTYKKLFYELNFPEFFTKKVHIPKTWNFPFFIFVAKENFVKKIWSRVLFGRDKFLCNYNLFLAAGLTHTKRFSISKSFFGETFFTQLDGFDAFINRKLKRRVEKKDRKVFKKLYAS